MTHPNVKKQISPKNSLKKNSEIVSKGGGKEKRSSGGKKTNKKKGGRSRTHWGQNGGNYIFSTWAPSLTAFKRKKGLSRSEKRRRRASCPTETLLAKEKNVKYHSSPSWGNSPGRKKGGYLANSRGSHLSTQREPSASSSSERGRIEGKRGRISLSASMEEVSHRKEIFLEKEAGNTLVGARKKGSDNFNFLSGQISREGGSTLWGAGRKAKALFGTTEKSTLSSFRRPVKGGDLFYYQKKKNAELRAENVLGARKKKAKGSHHQEVRRAGLGLKELIIFSQKNLFYKESGKGGGGGLNKSFFKEKEFKGGGKNIVQNSLRKDPTGERKSLKGRS